MRRIMGALAAIWMAGTAWADNTAIEGVIGSQLDAFNAREVDTAWGFASPTIQRLFGSSGNFGMMVERGYPMVWDNADVRFLELDDFGGFQVQKVMIRDAQGALHVLAYKMIETAQGWRIDGVSILPAPDVGA